MPGASTTKNVLDAWGYVDLGGGMGLDPTTGKTFVHSPQMTPAGQAGFGMQAMTLPTGQSIALQTAPNYLGSYSLTGVGSLNATGLPGVFPGTNPPPNPFLSNAVGMSGAFGMFDPYVITPGLNGVLPRPDPLTGGYLSRFGGPTGPMAQGLMGGGGSPLLGGGGSFPPGAGGGIGGFGLQLGGSPNIIPGASPGGGSPLLSIPGSTVPAGGQPGAIMPGLRAPSNAPAPSNQPGGAPGALPTWRAQQLAHGAPSGAASGYGAAMGGTILGVPTYEQLLGLTPGTAGGLVDPTQGIGGVQGVLRAGSKGPAELINQPAYGTPNREALVQADLINRGAPHAGGPIAPAPAVSPSAPVQGAFPSAVPGAPSGGNLPAPSTSGPFSPTPAGLGANLLLNEIARREQMLNTSEGMQQQALQALLQSPAVGGVDMALQELVKNPFPGSNPVRQQSAKEAMTRRLGQASEGALATRSQQLTDQGLRGGEAAGATAGADFQLRANIADALNQLETEFAQLHTAERGALQQGLASGAATQRAAVFNPTLDVSSFYERRSVPEISALLQLLGQQEALNAAQQVASIGAAGPGVGTPASSTAGVVTKAQLLRLLGL